MVVHRRMEKNLPSRVLATGRSNLHAQCKHYEKSSPFPASPARLGQSVRAGGARHNPNARSGNFYARWSAQTNAIQSKQPAWPPPLVTTFTGLFQVVRTDIVRQIAPARTDTWNFDNSKGVNFIPGGNLEFAINLPPYIEHNTTGCGRLGRLFVSRQVPPRQGTRSTGTST